MWYVPSGCKLIRVPGLGLTVGLVNRPLPNLGSLPYIGRPYRPIGDQLFSLILKYLMSLPVRLTVTDIKWWISDRAFFWVGLYMLVVDQQNLLCGKMKRVATRK